MNRYQVVRNITCGDKECIKKRIMMGEVGRRRNPPSENCMRILQKRRGRKNPNWKGNHVGIPALHQWVKRNKPKPSLCVDCNVSKPIDLANISQSYKRDINDFKWVCRRCHMNEDGRMNNLKQFKQFNN